VAEAPAEETEGAGLVAEATRGLGGREALDEEGAQGLVLPLARVVGLGEELSLWSYLVWCSLDEKELRDMDGICQARSA